MNTSLMTPDEKNIARHWQQAALGDSPPFSFEYNGITSHQFLQDWPVKRSASSQADGTIQHTVIHADQATGLECELVLTEYPESPAIEWVIYFRNKGTGNTPILANIQALDMLQKCATVDRAVLHSSKGTMGVVEDFILQQQELALKSEVKMLELNDGSSRINLPFFNLETGNEGVIVGLGWTGNWACSFRRQENGDVSIQAGLARTHLTLHPGEEIRSPRILVLFWKGDRMNGHNMLRRHLVAHHLPHPGGKDVVPPICCLTWGGMKTHNHLKLIQYIREHGIKYDYYWIDAGWFGPDHEVEEFQSFHTEDWAYNVGHWRVNHAVHPDGLKPIADAVHAGGMKLLLWFGPYLVEENAPLAKEHPEWMIRQSARGTTGIGGNPKPVKLYDYNLGIPEAQQTLLNLISGLIKENGVDCYRDDCGVPFEDDVPDRVGISEIKCVTAFYAFWDELLKRHPGLLIDNCSGGGSRIDLETIGRSLVMWRSDANCSPDADPIGFQVGTYGISHWVPLTGGTTPARPGNTYNFRSSWSGGLPFGFFHPAGSGAGQTTPVRDYPIEWHRQMMAQYRRARSLYTGDFYPLTNCTLSPRDWLAYQMYRVDLGEGLVMAFRRSESPFTTAEFKLKGLDVDADYELENTDTGEGAMVSGKELSETGVTITMKEAPQSALLFFKRLTRS